MQKTPVALTRNAVTSWAAVWVAWTLLVIGAVGCGSERKCPSGTDGDPCSPIGDLGAPPEIPSGPGDTASEVHSRDVADGGGIDDASAMDSETTIQDISGSDGDVAHGQDGADGDAEPDLHDGEVAGSDDATDATHLTPRPPPGTPGIPEVGIGLV